LLVLRVICQKGSLGTAVKMLSCDHEDHGFKSWKQPLAQMQEKTAYIRLKVVGPCGSGSYVHQAALYTSIAACDSNYI
jgi:hypothetical protein